MKFKINTTVDREPVNGRYDWCDVVALFLAREKLSGSILNELKAVNTGVVQANVKGVAII